MNELTEDEIRKIKRARDIFDRFGFVTSHIMTHGQMVNMMFRLFEMYQPKQRSLFE